MIRCELTITMSIYTTMNIDVSSDAYQIQQLRQLISKLQSDIGKRENAFEELNLRVQLLENHKRLVQTFFEDVVEDAKNNESRNNILSNFRNCDPPMNECRIQICYSHQLKFDDTISLPGQCVFAASAARRYYLEFYPHTSPEIVSGVLYCSNKEDMLIMANNTECTKLTKIASGAKSYKYECSTDGDMNAHLRCQNTHYKSCVWKVVDSPSIDEVGTNHTVIRLIMTDGEVILVDWSIGQFKEIPTSCVFYANF